MSKPIVIYDVAKVYPNPTSGQCCGMFLSKTRGFHWSAPVQHIGSNGEFETVEAKYLPNRVLVDEE